MDFILMMYFILSFRPSSAKMSNIHKKKSSAINRSESCKEKAYVRVSIINIYFYLYIIVFGLPSVSFVFFPKLSTMFKINCEFH